MNPFGKISIATRSLYPPLLLAAVMSAVVVLIGATYQAIGNGAAHSVRLGLASEQARRFADELQRGHTELYAAINRRSLGAEQRAIDEKTSMALNAWSKAADALEAVAASGMVAQTSLLVNTRQAFEVYLADARKVAGFGNAEASAAAMEVNGADSKFLDARASALAIGSDLAAQRQHIDDDATNALASALYRIGIATAAAILLSLAVAANLVHLVGAQAEAVAETIQAKDKLQEAYSRLEQQSGELTAATKELETALVSAEAANRAKSVFLANMSHELRTPLHAILGYAQLFKRDQSLGEWQVSAVNTIQRSGEHLLTLISDILDLSKIEAGRLELSSGIIDLPGFIGDIASIISVKAKAKNLSFIQDIPLDLPHFVQADGKRLRQVLLNLLGNAVKFTDRGRVELRVQADAQAGTEVRLRFDVRDTGVGVSAERLAVIFKPFEQVCDPQRRSGGAGLGLSISQELLHLMGSEIRVKSIAGRGSRFWFDLVVPQAEIEALPTPPSTAGPSHAAANAEDQKASGDAGNLISLRSGSDSVADYDSGAQAMVLASAREVAGYTGPRRSALIVDDVPENRAVLADTLRVFGFEIHQAENGFEGLKMAQAVRPDLILMDIMMPEMNGLDAMRHLRRMPDTRTVPIIAVSASVAQEDQSRSLAAGADRFLGKPIDNDQLFATIADLLQLSSGDIPIQPIAGSEGSTASLVVPPRTELEVLHNLARTGRMHKIRKQADHVATIDGRYRPFADRLQQMARVYDTKSILCLIEESLDQQRITVS